MDQKRKCMERLTTKRVPWLTLETPAAVGAPYRQDEAAEEVEYG